MNNTTYRPPAANSRPSFFADPTIPLPSLVPARLLRCEQARNAILSKFVWIEAIMIVGLIFGHVLRSL